MKTYHYTLEFIMPCFCAGADQSRAEIRASSIRGQLRWWFRALGGSPSEEREVFGGVARPASSSVIRVRVFPEKLFHNWNPPTVNQNSPESYVWYFASVSGKDAGSGPRVAGPRWQAQGALAPKSTFRLDILQLRPLETELQAKLDRTIRGFLQLGGIGLRLTRGLGTFFCREVPFTNAILDEIRVDGFRSEVRPGSFTSIEQLARTIGALVKGTRAVENPAWGKTRWLISQKKNISTPSPMGTSDPRQTSAVFFRPICRDPNHTKYELIVFEAPQDRVLDPASRKPSVVGHTSSRLVVS